MTPAEILEKLETVRNATSEWVNAVAMIDGNYQAKQLKIEALETRIKILEDEALNAQNKGNAIIQKANLEAAEMRTEAQKVLAEARAQRNIAQQEIEEAKKVKLDMEAVKKDAMSRKQDADRAWQEIEEKKRRMQAAINA